MGAQQASDESPPLTYQVGHRVEAIKEMALTEKPVQSHSVTPILQRVS
jgi:hypothetical protein